MAATPWAVLLGAVALYVLIVLVPMPSWRLPPFARIGLLGGLLVATAPGSLLHQMPLNDVQHLGTLLLLLAAGFYTGAWATTPTHASGVSRATAAAVAALLLSLSALAVRAGDGPGGLLLYVALLAILARSAVTTRRGRWAVAALAVLVLIPALLPPQLIQARIGSPASAFAVGALLAAVSFGEERPHPRQWLGVALATSAAILIALAARTAAF